MKIKNIYKKDINVEGKLLKDGETREIEDDKTDEIKNLVKQKYIEVIED